MTDSRRSLQYCINKMIRKTLLTTLLITGFVLWSPPSAYPIDLILATLNFMLLIHWMTRKRVLIYLLQQADQNKEPVIQDYLTFAFGIPFSKRKERHCWYYTTSYETMLSIYTMLQTNLQKTTANRFFRQILRFQLYLLTCEDVIQGIRIARYMHHLPSCQRHL